MHSNATGNDRGCNSDLTLGCSRRFRINFSVRLTVGLNFILPDCPSELMFVFLSLKGGTEVHPL